MYFERFGWHTAAEYATFADAYGFDVLSWPGYPVLRGIRETLMVTWLAQNTDRVLMMWWHRFVQDRWGGSFPAA